ncbi:hypothetical protein [Haloarcula litorea]|uniref:hypothetical protein n=1 Tax=Haloarcula litorea TaxID=3032579 RepID=UPI0023E85DE0|nr:hypothetical protein [Halomicroarcula sp. GDY20]
MTRVGTALWSGARELRRTPLLLALLVVAPAYVVGLFTLVAPDSPAAFTLDGTTVRTTLDAVFPAFTTPMTAALLSGIAGLFLMQNAAAADERLCLAGYRPHEVVVARFGLLVGVATVATAVSVAVMSTAFVPDRPALFAASTLLVALVYGTVGVVVGSLLDRLPGVYLLLFGSMVDLFVFQNPLATDPPAIATLLPGHYPLDVAIAAAFTDGAVAGALARTGLVLGVLTAAATLAFRWQLRSG